MKKVIYLLTLVLVFAIIANIIGFAQPLPEVLIGDDAQSPLEVPVSLSAAPDGLFSFSLTFAVTDTTVAEFTEATISDQFSSSSYVVEVAEDGSWIKVSAGDFGENIGSGSTDIDLATLELSAKGSGSATVSVDTVTELLDNEGSSINADASDTGTVTSDQPDDTPAKFRVDSEGNVYSDKSFYGQTFKSGNADLAEKVKVNGGVEPGDVLALHPTNPKNYRKSQKAYSPLATGVVSTEPGITLSEKRLVGDKITIALAGTVPVKATTENGHIHPGDLLTTSSKPGYAMVCRDTSKCADSIVGKAMGSLERSKGKIRMLVT